MIDPRPRARDRLLRYAIGLTIAAALIAVNYPTVRSWAVDGYHDYKINTAGYKRDKGHWSLVSVPKRYRVNAIHAALLRTGKVLIIAGSGNDQKRFDAGRFTSLLWDPATNKSKRVHTPRDMFCAGHAFLPDGKLLIAGGTTRYEVLAGQVKRAAGVMTVKNERPGGKPVTVAAGTVFTSPDGVRFRSSEAVRLSPATKVVGRDAKATVTAASKEVWVTAEHPGNASVVDQFSQFEIAGVPANKADDLYGVAEALTTGKQDFWGDDHSWVFDPLTERYEKVGRMKLARWYPTLVGLEDGRVLSVSGLDAFGRIIEGDNEVYDPKTKEWAAAPELKRTFPTYPALFLMPGGNLFYSGSNAGFGSDTVGRTPGIWKLSDNSFQVVPGLREPTQTETSGSVMLPPAQSQRYMVAGGGGIGDSDRSTARTDVVDLTRPNPRFTPGPDLGQPTRYPGMVVTPDDNVIITGGSNGYRGAGDSNIFECNLYNPRTNQLTRLSDATVGRNYHSEALLLPDGRIVTLGSDSLYGNKKNTVPGTFEQRIEVFSPPYLHRGNRPELGAGPRELKRGRTARFKTSSAPSIATARLIRPSAVTHVTDVEQRSVALDVIRRPGAIDLTLPESAGLVPAGWYMLFVTENTGGAPSQARWVHVS